MSSTAEELIKLERLRELLKEILISKGKIVDVDAPLTYLIPMVASIGVNDDFKSWITGTENFELIDEDGIIQIIKEECFLNNTKLTKLKLTNAETLNASCFRGSGVTEVILKNKNDLPITINNRSFQTCKSLKTVELGRVILVDTYTFNTGGTTLQKIVMEELVSSNGGSHFLNNTNLKIIDFGVTSNFNFNDNCLGGCNGIKAIVSRYDGIATLNTATKFDYQKDNATDWYIYVPDEYVEDYKVANNWSSYSEYIKPLSEYDEEAILNGEVISE